MNTWDAAAVTIRGHWYDFLSNALSLILTFKPGRFCTCWWIHSMICQFYTTDSPTMTLDLQPSPVHRSRVNRTLGRHVDESALSSRTLFVQMFLTSYTAIPVTLYYFLALSKKKMYWYFTCIWFSSFEITSDRKFLRLTNLSLLFLGHSSPAKPFELWNLSMHVLY